MTWRAPAATNRLRLGRVLAAFIAAPLAGAGAVAARALVTVALDSSFDLASTIAAKTLFFEAIRGYAVAALLGTPGYLLFRRMGWIRRAHWVLLWIFLGVIMGVTWPLLTQVSGGPSLPLILVGAFAVTGLLFGVASGLAFALIIKPRSPRPSEIAATFD